MAFRIQTYLLALDSPAAEYAVRMLKLPSMQEWYADALEEVFRDEPHEVEVALAGTVLEDLRAG